MTLVVTTKQIILVILILQFYICLVIEMVSKACVVLARSVTSGQLLKTFWHDLSDE